MSGRCKRRREASVSINALDDGCLSRVLSFLAPLPDRFNASRACSRWRRVISDSRMWLSVDSSSATATTGRPNQYTYLKDAVAAARPGDTIYFGSGGVFEAADIVIDKPLCLMGGGSSASDTVLRSPVGCESALVFSANAKLSNLTIKAALGSCLLHHNGNLTVDRCALECAKHPLEHLSCAIVSTADTENLSTGLSSSVNGVSVIETSIEGGSPAVKTVGSLALQQVRVVYSRAALLFWFTVASQQQQPKQLTIVSS